MTNKKFAEKNAGKYFLYEETKVRVVGYCATNRVQILISVPAHARYFGWGAVALDDDDVFVIRSKASNYWYVDQRQLDVWE